MKLPSHIWHLHGAGYPNQRVVILGGTHGNERTGVEIVETFLRALELLLEGVVAIDSEGGSFQVEGLLGDLYFGIGNPEAVRQDQRGATAEQPNLNRCFDPVMLADAKQDWGDLRRARELAPFLAWADVLIDVHAVSTEAVPFVCVGRLEERHLRYLRHFPVSRVLTDPDNILAEDSKRAGEKSSGLPTTDEVVNSHGGVGFAFETGNMRDFSRLPVVISALEALLTESEVADVEWINSFMQVVRRLAAEKYFGGSWPEMPASPDVQHVFALVECVVLDDQESDFRFEMGLDMTWATVQEGQLVATYESGKLAHASQSGAVIFPANPEKRRTEKSRDNSLFYLAQEWRQISR
ncbi:hypothetical protein COV03_04200 [Candidatus Uhrbacteria bacterium CG10_big_fil_rev_8_21_14_0_10_41_26]|nr:MAG: hypothetical protein CO086_02245 [Candidatus Uhrbacteria bacterium CG_4_9_14_0_8_um_filter_41_16]PJE74691.1 MAG: hypothetical protein COV03_04200 [Candidatus Uhrbacteria bacterium CG10_big_fil_rev_8_21_14_0_10_41_26]